MNMKQLKGEFGARLHKCDTDGKKFNPQLTALTAMLDRGDDPVDIVIKLIERGASGCEKLAQVGGLHFTIEWIVANEPKFHPLFLARGKDEIIRQAREIANYWKGIHPKQSNTPPI